MEGLRDSLVNLSLFLKDVQFQTESEQRVQAIEQAGILLEGLKRRDFPIDR